MAGGGQATDMANEKLAIVEVLSVDYAGTDGKTHGLQPGQFETAPRDTAFDERAIQIIAVVNGREIALRVKTLPLVFGSDSRIRFRRAGLSHAAMG